jgi:hypothetical protein
MDALLPTLYFGRNIVAFKGRFTPQTALKLMQRCGVTHTFLFPTALKAMMRAYPGTAAQPVRKTFGLQLQAIMSAGEAVGDAVFDYCHAQLGVTVNEMFGQTEINYIVGNSTGVFPAKPGSMGLAYPGHCVAVIVKPAGSAPAALSARWHCTAATSMARPIRFSSLGTGKTMPQRGPNLPGTGAERAISQYAIQRVICGTRAAATMYLSRRDTVLAQVKSKTAWSSTPLLPMRPWCPSPIVRAARW